MDDGKDYTAFRGVVVFRQNDACKRKRFAEYFGLLKGILSHDGVDDQEEFRVSRTDLPIYDSCDFLQFLHQVMSGMQASRSIGNDKVRSVRFCGTNGIEHHGGRVAPHPVTDRPCTAAVSPGFQLFDRRGPVGIRCCEHDAFSVPGVLCGQFPRRGRFPAAVHTGKQDYGRDSGLPQGGPVQGIARKNRLELFPENQKRKALVRARRLTERPEIVKEFFGKIDSYVSFDQGFLDLFPEIGTFVCCRNQLGQGTAPLGPYFFQSGFEPFEELQWNSPPVRILAELLFLRLGFSGLSPP